MILCVLKWILHQKSQGQPDRKISAFFTSHLIQSKKTKAEVEEMKSWKEWGTTQKISNRNSNHSLVSPICASYYVRTIYIM